MTISSNKNNSAVAIKPTQITSFRRIQWVATVWAVLLIIAGFLHSPINKAWGEDVAMIMWLIMALIGLYAMFRIAPEALSSGMLYVWGGLLVLAFIGQALLLHAFDGDSYSSTLWHFALAIGYLLIGIYMDRRWWWLFGWELLMTVLIMWLAIDNSNRATPLQFGDFIPARNYGWLFGLTSGIPLLIASLPFWKERYSR